MQLRYSFRVYPDADQRTALAKAFGCARVVYNDALRARETARAQGQAFPTAGELSKKLITDAKRTPEREWLGGVSAVVLQQALRDADTAYRNFFDGLQGKRPKTGPPRFKSRKDHRQSARFTANARWKITGQGKLSLPKIGEVKVKWSRPLPSAPATVTLLKDAADRYFASFVVRTQDEPLTQTTDDVGIDLGLGHFAVLSEGTRVANPRFLRRAQRKLRKAQRALSRKAEGSKNRARARLGVARVHARVADARREFHHQLSTTIIRDNQAVYVEDLCVKGLGRTRLAKSVHDAGWAAFVSMLEYKAARYGRTFARVDRFLPSSQTCHTCWVVDGPKPLHVRKWTCRACGTIHDRDVNASRVVLAAGRKLAGAREAES
ncbi:RNA-guided endonuclease TnpB family protein [Nocardiopsis tropica]|uniref:RNA-guided endonuclease InsQ/TnpB family protein n=1 Tax=Nocardiopsis tropica TaxID=109330 RepID=UPI002E8CCCD2|nr:RNA-guided endonuclease TnpB family protein [Nocardiopsis tropica]